MRRNEPASVSRASLVRGAVMHMCAFGVVGMLVSCGRSQGEEEAGPSTAAPGSVLAEVAAWRAIGGVTDARSLALKPGTGRNAADMHRPLIDIMATMSAGDKALVTSPWTAPVGSLKYVLESYERELATVGEALSLPYCNWGSRFEDGMEMELPHLAFSRSVARLLVADAVVKSDAGDYQGAAKSLQDILRLSDQVGTDPLAIVIAVRFSLDRSAIDGMHQRFYEEGLNEALGIGQVIAGRNYRAELKRALLGEGAIGIDMYRKAAGGDAGSPIEEQPMSPAVADELVWYLRTVRLFVEQANRPYYDMTALAETPRKPAGQVVEPESTDPAQFDRMCRWAASAENYAAVARLALKLREHKAKNGEYPDPREFKTPNDMLTGRPIGYDRFSDGFILRFAHVDFEGNRTDAEWEW